MHFLKIGKKFKKHFWLTEQKTNWRMRVSIPLPRTCEARALPFELIPPITRSLCERYGAIGCFIRQKKNLMFCLKIHFQGLLRFKRRIFFWINVFFKKSRFLINQTENNMEDTGIDPATSRMQSARSTIWANPPKNKFKLWKMRNHWLFHSAEKKFNVSLKDSFSRNFYGWLYIDVHIFSKVKFPTKM